MKRCADLEKNRSLGAGLLRQWYGPFHGFTISRDYNLPRRIQIRGRYNLSLCRVFANGVNGGDFSQGLACDEIRQGSSVLQHTKQGDGNGQNCGLGIRWELKVFFGTLET